MVQKLGDQFVLVTIKLTGSLPVIELIVTFLLKTAKIVTLSDGNAAAGNVYE